MPIFVFIFVFCLSMLVLTDWDGYEEDIQSCEEMGGFPNEGLFTIDCQFPKEIK